jgi:hypothetical protein
MEQLQILENYINKYYPNIKGSDYITLTDIIYMAAIRNNIDIKFLVDELYKGILDLDKFRNENKGNIYDFINPKFKKFAERIKDINVGSNGGMANVGKGEWLISLLAGIDTETETPRVNIIKKGKGDLQFNDSKKTEEVKWNGGKVSVEKPGNEIKSIFNSIISIDDKEWVPFREKDKKKYSKEEIGKFNAAYWKAISENNNDPMNSNELKQKIIDMAYNKVFENCDTFIMFNDDGKFQRFININEVNIYYEDKLELLIGSKKGFECRANQTNPIALYCHVF